MYNVKQEFGKDMIWNYLVVWSLETTSTGHFYTELVHMPKLVKMCEILFRKKRIWSFLRQSYSLIQCVQRKLCLRLHNSVQRGKQEVPRVTYNSWFKAIFIYFQSKASDHRFIRSQSVIYVRSIPYTESISRTSKRRASYRLYWGNLRSSSIRDMYGDFFAVCLKRLFKTWRGSHYFGEFTQMEPTLQSTLT